MWSIGYLVPRRNESRLWNFFGDSTMELHPDFRDLLKLLNEHDVEYLVVGAYALAFHGAPRYTGDLDVFVRPDSANARRVIEALSDFGFSFPNLTEEDFQNPDKVVQLGVPPVRIDLITSISGVSWEQADAGKVSGVIGDISVNLLGREEFLANKRASGRKKDLADVEALGEE